MNGVSSTTYSCDCHGQLPQINFPGGKWEKFYYDGLGRRIKTEYYDGYYTTTTRRYVYLGGSVIRELDNDNPPNVLKEYIYIRGLEVGGGIGGIVYQKKSSDYYYYHYNHKGDVCALTDASQNLAAYYEYDAWGNTMTEAEKAGVDNPYRYSTKEWDDDSGLYYFGARYYSPEIGRWTQRDPSGTIDSLNLYLYVNNDPLNRIDLWGLQDPSGAHGIVKPLGPTVDIGIYVFRSGPAWLFEVLPPFFSTSMCHYWMDVLPTSWRVDLMHGLQPLILTANDPVFDPSAMWPAKWEQSPHRTNALTGKTCDCTSPSDIYDCIEQMLPGILKKYSWSCVKVVWEIEKACCLREGKAIFNNPFADPIGWPEWMRAYRGPPLAPGS